MRIYAMLAFSFIVLGLGRGAWADSRPIIVAAAVEETATADIVRLVINPVEKNLEHKIVCTDSMIRVRLNGIANRTAGIQELLLPKKTSFRRARIVAPNNRRSVVQLVPRRRTQAACARTSVAMMGGEVIISTARENVQVPADTATAVSKKEELAAQVPKTAASNPTVPAKKVDNTGQTPSGKTEKPLGFMAKENKPQPETAKQSMGEEYMDAPKIAFVFGFAALVAGMALYLKRRKKNPLDEMGRIEILSTKRLGLKQQLTLVSVHGTKFLLAVGDKSVSALGTVPEEGAIAAAPPSLPHGTGPDQFGTEETFEPSIESLVNQVKDRTQQTSTQQNLRPETTRFDKELGRALDATLFQPERPDNPTSNAAGLVALARMRANFKKGQTNAPTFEA